MIGPRGDIVWMCAPRWDSDAVFSSLHRRDRRVRDHPHRTPTSGAATTRTASLIWRSRWVTDTGIIECREALAFPGEAAPGGAAAPDPSPSTRRHAVAGRAATRAAGFDRHQLTDLHRRRRHVDRRAPAACTLRWTRRPVTPVRRRRRPAPARRRCTSTPGSITTWSWNQRPRPAGAPRRPGRRLARHRNRLAAGRSRRWTPARTPATRATAYAVLRGLTSRQRRHGRRRHHQPARTRRSRPQLRLPLRVDPRPVLRRPGRRRRRRRTRCSTTPSASSPTGCSTTATDSPPPTPPPATPVPDQQPPRPARLPRRARHRSATGSTGSSNSTRSAKPCCCSPPPPATTGWTPSTGKAVDSRRRRDRRAAGREPDAGIWEIDNRPWTHSRLICAAGLRAIAAARRRPPPPPTGSPSPTTSSPTPPRTPCTPPDAGNAPPTTPALDAALLLPALRGAIARRRPAHHRHPARLPARPDPRRLRLPLPPRRSTLAGCRRIVPALRIPRGTQPGPTRPSRSRPEHGTNAPAPPADRRNCSARNTTPAASNARQPPASLRPRPGDRDVGPTRALSSSACLTSTSTDTATKLLQVSRPWARPTIADPPAAREHRTGKPVAGPIVPWRRDRPGPRIAQPVDRPYRGQQRR